MKHLAISILTALIASQSHAGSAWLGDLPTNTIDVLEATKTAGAGKSVVECQKKKAGPRVNPINVPGSKPVYVSTLPKGIDNPGELLGAGKTAVLCVEKAMDMSSGRLKKVQ